MDDANAYPLSWPFGWERTAPGDRRRATFRIKSMARALSEVFDELKRMGVPDWNVIVSSNVELRRDGLPYSNRRAPDDPGVSVYFRFPDKQRYSNGKWRTIKGESRVLACDKWTCPEHNLWAIVKHIEAMRGQDRWGVGSLDRAFSAYKALPRGGDSANWPTILGVAPDAPDAPSDEVRAAYVAKVKQAHPDHGGTSEALQSVHQAWKDAVAAGAST